jgi:transcriptional regulator with XRE-family HTH domain
VETKPARLAFGAVLREFRKTQNLTQQEVADGAGYEVGYIARLERGEFNPTLHLIVKVALGLGIDSRQLFSGIIAELEREAPEYLVTPSDFDQGKS